MVFQDGKATNTFFVLVLLIFFLFVYAVPLISEYGRLSKSLLYDSDEELFELKSAKTHNKMFLSLTSFFKRPWR